MKKLSVRHIYKQINISIGATCRWKHELHLLLNMVHVERNKPDQHLSAVQVSLQKAGLLWGWDALHVFKGEGKCQDTLPVKVMMNYASAETMVWHKIKSKLSITLAFLILDCLLLTFWISDRLDSKSYSIFVFTYLVCILVIWTISLDICCRWLRRPIISEMNWSPMIEILCQFSMNMLVSFLT